MATLLKQVQGFVKGQLMGGVRGLALMEETIDHMFEHNDWTPLAWLIAKSDAKDVRIYRAILGATVGGISLTTRGKKAIAQPSGLHIERADNYGPTDKMPVLRQLVADRETFRGQVVQKELLGKEAAAFNFEKYVATVLKKLEKEGKTLGDFDNEARA